MAVTGDGDILAAINCRRRSGCTLYVVSFDFNNFIYRDSVLRKLIGNVVNLI